MNTFIRSVRVHTQKPQAAFFHRSYTSIFFRFYSFKLIFPFPRSAISLANPKVYFDLDVGGKDAGRVTFELYSDVVPKTVNIHHLNDRIDSCRPKTFVLSALERKGLVTKEANSIALSHSSCVKVATLL
jgi:hypothetical protein